MMLLGKTRKHIEFYIFTIVLIAVSVYDYIEGVQFTSKLLAPAFVAIFYAVFRLQSSIEELDESNDDVLEKVVHDFPKDFSKRIRSAKEIYFMGVHPGSLLSDYARDFEYALERNGAKFVCLMIPSNSAAVKMTASRFTSGADSVEKEKNRIRECHHTIREWKEKYGKNGDSIILKEKDYLFEKASLILDINASNGVVFEQRYTFRVCGGSQKPKFKYNANSEWMPIIRKEFSAHFKDKKCKRII